MKPPRQPFHITPAGYAWIVGLSFLFFWFHRAQRFAGDGPLIARITEDGKWLVKNELLSQFLIQLLYQGGSFISLPPLTVLNFTACLGGALALGILLRGSQTLYKMDWPWPLLFFLSSGFFIFACGHTEYYPLLLPALFAYGFGGLLYIQGKLQLRTVSLLFVLGCALHMAMLITLPSLLALPWLAKKRGELTRGFSPLLLLFLLFLLRDFPQLTGHKAASLSSGWHGLPLFPYEGMGLHYAFFDLDHALDWFYGLALRSWLFWPLIFWGIQTESCLTRPDRLFLLLYTLPLTAWTLIWHPDLGMPNDWDLFAIEAAPCLLLALSYLPRLAAKPAPKAIILTALVGSALCQHGFIIQQADFPRRGTGTVVFHLPPHTAIDLTIDARYKNGSRTTFPAGIHTAKCIDRTNRISHNLYFHLIQNTSTTLSLSPTPNP
jgi:hypothetical protein